MVIVGSVTRLAGVANASDDEVFVGEDTVAAMIADFLGIRGRLLSDGIFGTLNSGGAVIVMDGDGDFAVDVPDEPLLFAALADEYFSFAAVDFDDGLVVPAFFDALDDSL